MCTIAYPVFISINIIYFEQYHYSLRFICKENVDSDISQRHGTFMVLYYRGDSTNLLRTLAFITIIFFDFNTLVFVGSRRL